MSASDESEAQARTSKGIEDLLGRHLPEPFSPDVAVAIGRLRGSLRRGERPLEVADASHDNAAGVLAITTQGLVFAPTDSAGRVLRIKTIDIGTAERDSDTDAVIVIDADQRQHRFEQLGGTMWPAELASIIRRLAYDGPEGAGLLADQYDEEAASDTDWRPSRPQPAVPDSPVRDTKAGQFAIAIIWGLGVIVLIWTFMYSNVTVGGPTGERCGDGGLSESSVCGGVRETLDGGADAAGFNIETSVDSEGRVSESYDCGSIGGASSRALTNSSGTPIEAAADRKCGNAANKRGAVAVGALLVLGGALYFLKSSG